MRDAAFAAVKLDWLLQQELDRSEDLAQTARRRWDKARARKVAEQAILLRRDPSRAVDLLRETAEGCAFLADEWEVLIASLEFRGGLDLAQLDHALRLLGGLRDGDQADFSDAAFFRDLAMVVGLIQPDAAPEHPGRLGDDDPQAFAFGELLEFARSMAGEAERRMDEIWELYDRRSRQRAPSTLAFDASKSGRLLARYISDAERMKRQALAAFYRHRRESSGTHDVEPTIEETTGLNEPEQARSIDASVETQVTCGEPSGTIGEAVGTGSEPVPVSRNEPEPIAADPAEPGSDEAGLTTPQPPEAAPGG